MAKNDDIIWRTIGGRRIPIKKGQSLSEAMKESGKFKKKKDDEIKEQNQRGSNGKAIDFNRQDDTFKYTGSYNDNLLRQAKEDSIMVEEVGKQVISAIEDGTITNQKELNAAFEYGDFINNPTKYHYGYGYSVFNQNKAWTDDLRRTKAKEEIITQTNYWKEKAKIELEKKATSKNEYLTKGEMMKVIDRWSSEGFEEGKYKSNYGKGVFHEKYASGQLEGYGGEEDDFVIRGFDLGSAPEKEALDDLNDELSKYGYKARYLKDGTVHQDIEIKKMKKGKEDLNKSLNALNKIDDIAGDDEKLQTLGRKIGANSLVKYRNAWEEYKKEHPNSKITLYQFIKMNEE